MLATMIDVGLVVGCISLIVKLITRIVQRFGGD